MQMNRIAFLSLAILAVACTVPKDARMLKRTTREWRESPVLLSGYSDSPLGSTMLTLRENATFERTSSIFGMNLYEAGVWAMRQDTIILSFVDGKLQQTKTEGVYLNREKYRLFFNGDTSGFGMRVMMNKL
jgi:hypothetical protein